MFKYYCPSWHACYGNTDRRCCTGKCMIHHLNPGTEGYISICSCVYIFHTYIIYQHAFYVTEWESFRTFVMPCIFADFRFVNLFIPIYRWEIAKGVYQKPWTFNIETNVSAVLPTRSRIECCLKCWTIVACAGVDFFPETLMCHMYDILNITVPQVFGTRQEVTRYN